MSHRLALLLALVSLLAYSAPPDGLSPFSVVISVGMTDTEETEWTGTFTVSRGTIDTVREWHGGEEQSFPAGRTFSVTTKCDVRKKQGRPVQAKLVVTGSAGPEATLSVNTNHGTGSVNLAGLRPGKPALICEGAILVETGLRATALSGNDKNEHDYPVACVAPDGAVTAVWQTYVGRETDKLMIASRGTDGTWGPATEITGVTGDIAHAACAATADGLVVVWSRRLADAWDLEWTVRAADGSWRKPQRLTDTPGTDLECRMAATPDGKAVLVWQGFADGSFEVLTKTYAAGTWSQTVNLSDDPANDWRPAVAIGPDGQVGVAWDSYRFGSYDILARRIVNGIPGETTVIAASPAFEANASVAYDGTGRFWIAWEEGPAGWGKDQGAVVPKPKPGTGLYGKRQAVIRILEGDRVLEPATQPSGMPAIALRQSIEKPRLCADAEGRVHLAFRTVHQQVKNHPWGHGRFRSERAWENHVATYASDKWLRPLPVPHHYGRIDSFPCPLPNPSGGLTVVFHSDERTYKDIRRLTRNQVFAVDAPSFGNVPEPALKEVDAPAPARIGKTEVEDTVRIRDFRTTVNGETLRIARGDTHRHTEISWDGNGDGSVIDMFRYGIDAGALDFIMVSDHNQRTGADIEYVWWRSEKISDLYNNPPVFTTLLGYERSLGFPNGHRNVINARRGVRSFPMTKNPKGKGVADDDTKQLYADARKTGSIIISHTSGTRMGTDWRDNDPELEPVVEIYQGARTSYEYEGAPKSAQPGDSHAKGSGYQPEGFVWRAWKKGLRLGIIASSDHGSTHISYASVYTPELSRGAIVESLRKRQTFGATDNIILDFRTGDQFMGREFTSAEPPVFTVKVRGTADLSAVEIVKNYRFVYVKDPEGTQFEAEWRDTQFEQGENIYYLRVQQTDGQIAWSSPIWINNP